MEPERQILPALHAFVAFRIDLFASLDPEILEDPETLAACNNLVNKTYVALAERESFYKPRDPYNECILEFVVQGEPKSSPSRFMDASMSVPIAPMTTDTHPSGRIPLQPSTSLPWNDCYISCFFSTLVISPTLFTMEPVNWILDRQESTRHRHFIYRDIQRSKDLEEDAAAEDIATAIIPAPTDGTPVKEPPGHSQAHSVRSSNSTKRRSISSNRSGADSTGSGCFDFFTDLEAVRSTDKVEGDDLNAELKAIEELRALEDFLGKMDYSAPPGMITVNFSHDLSTVTELNPPEEYFKEVETIARIQEEGRRRIAESRARAIRLALAQDTARYDERTFDLLRSRAPAAPALPATGQGALEGDATPAPNLNAVGNTEIPNSTAGPVPSIHSLAQDVVDSKEAADAASSVEATATGASLPSSIARITSRMRSRVKRGAASVARYVRRLVCP
ncbi:hypothetical protein C8R46DRAFT_683339 [Mycena filopes]|nr:hypothetical protein C8R46DRAFT_683339 [Mycena filopes]